MTAPARGRFVTIEFTAHNILLDDGTRTMSATSGFFEDTAWLTSARRVLDTVFPGDRTGIRIADLGCLEGGYTVEFARMGFDAVGIEVRDSNFAACEHVRARVSLPNLSFIQDNAMNIAAHGPFDAVFCCGLLYHLDRPRALLDAIGKITRKAVILNTHFSLVSETGTRPFSRRKHQGRFRLSSLQENEGLHGRWFLEFASDEAMKDRESKKWASWDNKSSFWILREDLIHAVATAGFDMVFEQFDQLKSPLNADLRHGYYKTDQRGMFVGIKT
jgi:SAM-dependent methyltransferase